MGHRWGYPPTDSHITDEVRHEANAKAVVRPFFFAMKEADDDKKAYRLDPAFILDKVMQRLVCLLLSQNLTRLYRLAKDADDAKA